MRFGHALISIVVAVVFLSACGKTAQAPAPAAAVAFTDISGIFAEQAIKDMAGLGIFDSTTGEFKPSAPIMRAEFVRWLVKANNTYYKDAPDQQIRLAESGTATFVDVPATHPDFKYIQGMANAGYVIGIDATHFAPDQPLTREQLVAIKVSRDEAGATIKPMSDYEIANGMYGVNYSDRMKINKIYTGYIHEDTSVRTSHNIGRIWGTVKTFNPQMPVTRAEAAVCLSAFGGEIPDATAAKASGRVK